MTLCIAGKNAIAVDVLRSVAHRHDVICLPNPEDDGTDDWQPSLRRAAEQAGVRTAELPELELDPELTFLTLEYSKIIRPQRFASAKLFNIHFSLLPKYRGCNTAIWPILNGETEHGVTLHRIDAGIDTGEVIDKRAFALGDMTAFEVYMTCQQLGTELALDWIDRLIEGQVESFPQVGPFSAYRRDELDFALKEIDLGEDLDHVCRRLRAFTFPAFQLPTLNGTEIIAFDTAPQQGFRRFMTATGPIFLQMRGPEG